MLKTESKDEPNPSQRISSQISDLRDWRGTILARLRQLILEAVPGITEEWKWDTAVWAHNGLVCSAAVFKDHVKLNFFKGAALDDPQHLFNAGLDAKASRAIDFNQGGSIDEPALKDLVSRAAAQNLAAGTKK
jgi:hypothetical protein